MFKSTVNPQTPSAPKYSQASGVTLPTVFSLPVDVSQHHAQPFAPTAPFLFCLQRRSVANLPFVLLRETETQKNYFLSGKKTSRIQDFQSTLYDTRFSHSGICCKLCRSLAGYSSSLSNVSTGLVQVLLIFCHLVKSP